MADRNLELALKIKALVEGAQNVKGLADEVGKLQQQSGKPLPDPTPRLRDGVSRTSGLVDELVKSMAGLLTLGAIKGFVSSAIAEFNKAEAGFRGLEAVANRSGLGIARAMEEAKSISEDGLVSLVESQKALQNLLSRGYNIDQAKQTIAALKDSAVTGRAAHLSLGEAVVTATEGLRNENSILVDNAGVTKNVSVMWKEYAAQVGKSVTELTQQEKVQAEVNGILRESAAFMGQAAEASGTLQGQMAKANTELKTMIGGIGQELAPAMAALASGGSAVLQHFVVPLIRGVKIIGAAFGAAAVDINNLWTALRTRDFSDFFEKSSRNAEQFRDVVDEIINKPIAPTFDPKAGAQIGTGAQGGADDPSDPAAEKAAAKERARIAQAEMALRAELSAQAARLEQDDLQRQIDGNKEAWDLKLIDARDYYTALSELQRQQADSEIGALEAQRAAALAAGAQGGRADQLKAEADAARIATEIELVRRRSTDQQTANAAALAKYYRDAATAAQDFIDGIEQEAYLSGLTNDERETALLLLEAEKLGITDVNRLLEAQGEIRAANAEKEAAEAIKRQQDDLYQSVQEGVQRGFAAGLDAIAAGEGGWQGALRSMVESLRLAFSNALSASLTDGFLGMLGGKQGVLGMAGSMGLGGKRDGSNPANAVYVQDVAAAVPGADGADGGLLGGLGNLINTMMAGLKAGLTSLVSGFGDLLGGLFGSAGGGQNWIGAIASMFGFADGGYTGPGGKYQPAGVVHAGEYVFSAESVRRLGLSALDNLHRLAKGGIVPAMPRWGYAEGGLVNLPAQQAGGAGGANIRIVNAIDPAMAGEFFNSPAGEKVFFNLISRNSAAMRQILA